MLLTENDIRKIVKECVRHIICEKLGFIDEKLFQLGTLIYQETAKVFSNKKIKAKITISKNIVAQYYPYSNPSEINILIEDNMGGKKIEYKNKTLFVNILLFKESKQSIIAKIIHELTHFVNDNEGTIRTRNIIVSDMLKDVNRLIYFLRDTERNARCSEFAYYLKNETKIRPIEYYEAITHIKEIEGLIYHTYIFKLFIKKRYKISFEHLEKQFEKYKQKIFKIYHFFLSLKNE